MKVEIGSRRPEAFKEYWPGQYELFSHFEYACGIPHVLFVITTVKENGKPMRVFTRGARLPATKADSSP